MSRRLGNPMTTPYPEQPPEPTKRGPSRVVVILLLTLAVVVTVGLVVVLIGIVTGNDGTSNRSKSTVTVVETTSAPPSETTTTTTSSSKTTTTTTPTRSSAGLFDNAPLSPGLCESDGLCRLSSPTGNFMCYLDAVSATCTAPRGETLVEGMRVNAITVNDAGKAELATLSAGSPKLLTRPEIGVHVFPYGNQVSAFGFTCAMGESTGVSCRQDDSGKGFSVTKEEYFFFQ